MLFSVLMSVASFVMMTEGESVGPMMLVMFLLITVINTGVIIRIKKNKKYIIIPMLGMYLVAIMTALVFEFIRDIIDGNKDAIGAAVFVGICELITILSMYGMHKGMSIKPGTETAKNEDTESIQNKN